MKPADIKPKNLKEVTAPQKTETPESSFTVKGDSASLSMAVTKPIRTLEQLIKVAEIDTEVWEIERYTCNKWEVAGYNRDNDQFTVQELWQVKATLKKRVDVLALKEIGKIVLDEIRKESIKVPKMDLKKFDDPCLFEADLFDAHIGKLAWGAESGKNYDLKIARSTYISAVKKLIERARHYQIEKILYPIGNDYMNVNGESSTTFAGTPQHEDQRWQKTFREGWKIISESIDMLSQIAPVHVVTVVGNHDVEPAFYIGEILAAKYSQNKNLTFDNGPTQRKYFRYGKCLIGFTHGKHEKITELPLIMANERSKDFSETRFREWHLGDKHHKKEYRWLTAEESKGITVRILRALTETDAWHSQKGYIANIRAAEGFIWHKENGLICNLSVNL